MTEVPVNPQIQEVLAARAAGNSKPVDEQTPAQMRAQYERTFKERGIVPTPVGAVEDGSIPGPGGDLPVRIYRPDLNAGDLPALVYFHGGGHVVGSLDTHDAVARNLCNGAGCVVMSVGYRLAPEHKFPAAAEDAYAAVRWCAAHGTEIGIDLRRMAVGGDSAGGNLAAVAALMARDAGDPPIRLQVLIYPMTDYAYDTDSYRIYAEGYGLQSQLMRWLHNQYLRGKEDRFDWRAAPLRARDLSGLPPALVLTAQCDILHDEGEAYAERLRVAGVEVEYHECQGMIHGFFTMAPMIDDAVRAQKRVCDALRRAMVPDF